MSDAFWADRGRANGFSLVIDNIRPIPVSELIAILRDMDSAFYEFSRTRSGRGYHLSANIAPGSIEIVWDVVSKVWGAKDLLAPFGTHLMDVAASLLGYEKADATKQDLKAIESISKPVSAGHARQINFVNNGTINVVVNVGNANQVGDAARTQRNEMKSEALEEGLAENVLTKQEISRISSSLERGDLMGTLFTMDGRWYARMLDSEGVLVPVRGPAESGSDFEHGAAYQFRGRPVLGTKGQLVAMDIYEAIPLANRRQLPKGD